MSISLELEETQIVVIQSLESPLCKEIISFKDGFESKEVEGKSKKKEPKQKQTKKKLRNVTLFQKEWRLEEVNSSCFQN